MPRLLIAGSHFYLFRFTVTLLPGMDSPLASDCRHPFLTTKGRRACYRWYATQQAALEELMNP